MSHNIRDLWEECHLLLERVFSGQNSGELQTVKEIITQFSVIDPTSQGFRYPLDTKGKASLPEGLDNINLGHLTKTVGGIADFLENLQFGVSYRLSRKLEAQGM